MSLSAKHPFAAAGSMLAVAGLAALSLTALTVGPASAFSGSELTVEHAVLTGAEMASATGWDNATDPLAGGAYQQDTDDWENDVVPATDATDAQTVPFAVELVAKASTTGRDAAYPSFVGGTETVIVGSFGGTVVSSTSSRTVLEASLPAYWDPYANWRETTVLQKAGGDGYLAAVCVSTPTTTTTQATRISCAEKLANAQAAAWARISPSPAYFTTHALKARLLSTKAARSACKLGKHTSTKVTKHGTKSLAGGGREVYLDFRTSAGDLKTQPIAVPLSSGVAQYGDANNATAALAVMYAADKKHHTIRDHTSGGYTILVPVTLLGHHTFNAVTVLRYRSVLVVVAVDGNPLDSPHSSTIVADATRLARAQLAAVKPVVKH